jgi:hypothetical protein
LTVSNLRIVYAERSQHTTQHSLSIATSSREDINTREGTTEIFANEMLVR